MSLQIVNSRQEQLVGSDVTGALREGLARCGAAVLLVPSFAQALDAQRALAGERGLALAVTTTTPAAWAKERWEVWGDGRVLADATVLTVLAREVLYATSPASLSPLEPSFGLAHVLAQLVGGSLPWLPLAPDGSADADACAQAGLTQGETRLVSLAGALGARLAQRGFVSAASAMAAVPSLLKEAGAQVPAVVLAGFDALGRPERALVAGLAELTPVTVVLPACAGPAAQQAEQLAAALAAETTATSAADSPAPAACAPRAAELQQLLDVLFTGAPLPDAPTGAVEQLLPSGPVAEAELVARTVERLLRDDARQIVVATPDVARARRELVPKLAARGIPVRLAHTTALPDCPSAQAFFAFASTVAHLAELDATWPAPVDGLDGPMVQLGDMSWWPPRELSDFLLSDIAHAGAPRAWWADAAWRGNRLLSPAALLAMLQSEKDTSPSVARATAELLRGRVGTAASKLLAPYVESLAQPAPALADAQAEEPVAVLQAILQLAGTLRELGVTADPAQPGALSLSELVEVMEWAARGKAVVTREETDASVPEGILPNVTDRTESQAAPTPVLLTDTRSAARLAPGSADALVLCGLTTAEQPIAAADTLLQAVRERLAIEPPADPMAQARSSFRALVAVPRTHLVLERALHDADSKPTYPSVMLSELLEAYARTPGSTGPAPALPQQTLPETDLSHNLRASATPPRPTGTSTPAPAGQLTGAARSFVFVPQDGRVWEPGAKPVLSASQIETYLDCPYKWFSLRRLRLGTVDAGHTGMEMGTFAHRVLEVTHRELLARALEAAQPGVPRDDLLAQVEQDPACHVPGSRVDEATLAAARTALDLEFDLHQQHMYMVRRPRQAQQLLIAHSSADRAQEDQLRADLLSCLQYQTRILQGFEPRLFEWSFGRHGNLVEYAGAYFTGTVDRIDVSPHGTAVIIDYKHKSPAGFAAEYDALQEGVLEGERLPNRVQSLIYAQVVRRAFAGRLRLVGSVYLATKSPHALAGVADQNVCDLVFGRVSKQRQPRVSVPPAADGASGMDALLDRTEELVAEQVRQMLAGNVEARPRDARSCDFCPVMQCERRMSR